MISGLKYLLSCPFRTIRDLSNLIDMKVLDGLLVESIKIAKDENPSDDLTAQVQNPINLK